MSFFRFENLSSRSKRGLILVAFGFLCFSSALGLKGYQEWQQNILSFSQAPQATQELVPQDLPEKILIPKTRIDLPVFTSRVVNNQWEISEKGVSYLFGSGIPGQKGNVVIYGHNKKYLFGPIRWLEKGDEIKITNKKGEEFIYKVVGTKKVTPSEIGVLLPTGDATLTLYTCTGFLDKERFVIIAKL